MARDMTRTPGPGPTGKSEESLALQHALKELTEQFGGARAR